MNTSKSGPVRGGACAAPPIGVGGLTPPIGMLMEAPLNVPEATGAPNRSCTLRTSYVDPADNTVLRSTLTLALRPQLYTMTVARPASYALRRTNTCGIVGLAGRVTSVSPSPVFTVHALKG